MSEQPRVVAEVHGAGGAWLTVYWRPVACRYVVAINSPESELLADVAIEWADLAELVDRLGCEL